MEGIHGPWRTLFSTKEYSFQEGLTGEERIALSYDRLRQMNSTVADPLALVNDMESLSALHGWAGVVDAGMATIASIHYNLFLGSLLDHGYDGHTLSEFRSMRHVGTFLCTEAAHGNNAVSLETTATFDRSTGGFILNTPNPGACKFMPNTSIVGGPKSAVVAARLIVDSADHGVFLFLTPLTDSDGRHLPGVEVRRIPETASSPVDHCITTFHAVPLPFDAFLQADHGRLTPDGVFTSTLGSPRKRFLRSIGRVTAGKLCMASYSLGVTRHALAVAMRYAHTRQTSGMTSDRRVALIAHRSHHAPLLSAVATTYAATLLHRSLVQRWALGDTDGEEVERLTAIAKGWITWQGRRIMTECRERCGAQGLLLANGIAGQLAANEGAITAEGDNLVIWVKAAGETLLGGFIPPALDERDPKQRSMRDPRHLQDLLSDLERIRYEDARARLRSGRHPSPLARWNAAVAPALDLVDAHVHRLAAETLLAGAEEAESSLARQLLTDLHGLFVVQYIRAHSGELLAHGRLTADQFRELRDTTDHFIGSLEPYALDLVEGFAVPEGVLKSHPILAGTSASSPA